MKSEFSAKSIYDRVAVGECDWTLAKVKRYLAKHEKQK